MVVFRTTTSDVGQDALPSPDNNNKTKRNKWRSNTTLLSVLYMSLFERSFIFVVSSKCKANKYNKISKRKLFVCF